MCWKKLEMPTKVLANIATIGATLIALYALFVGTDVVSETKYLAEQSTMRTIASNTRKAIDGGDLNAVKKQVVELSKYPEYSGIEMRLLKIEQSDEASKIISEGSSEEKRKISNFLLNDVGFEPQ